MRTRLLTRLGAVAAGGVLALGVGSPAAAQETLPLNPSHEGATAAGFQQECNDQFFDELGDNEDGWHFVAPANRDFISLSLVYEDADGVEVPIDLPADPRGFIREDQSNHAYVFTPAGWTLLSGSAEIGAGEGNPTQFQLSHTCAGEPDDDNGDNGNGDNGNGDNGNGDNGNGDNGNGEEENGNGDENGDDNGKDDDQLPVTGMQVGTMVGLGALLLLAGGGTIAFMAIRRRRNLANLLEG